MADLTSANCIIVLSIPLVLPTPQQLQQFATDDIFSTSTVVPVQVEMGVDGTLSGGYVPREKKTMFRLQGNSPSNSLFDAWAATQDANQAAFPAVGTITLPSLGITWALAKGFLTGYMPIVTAKKIIQSREFEITWESIVGSPVGLGG
jgi:hypothetical protein